MLVTWCCFLYFSVHGEDTKILPVHYTDNYFSLVPGESMPVTFEIPLGVISRVTLEAWNYDGAQRAH